MKTERIAELVDRVQSFEDLQARATALELLQAVMDFHASGLEHLVEIVAASEGASSVMELIAEDREASNVLLVHDLHPFSLEDRISRVLQKPEFQTKEAGATLGTMVDGVVRVRVEGSRELKATLERALHEAAPDAASIVIEGGASSQTSSNFVPLEQLLAS